MKKLIATMILITTAGCIAVPKYVSTPALDLHIADKATGAPVRNALVCLFFDRHGMIFGMSEEHEDLSRYTFTDSDGNCRIGATRRIAHSTTTTLGTVGAPTARIFITVPDYEWKEFNLSTGAPPSSVTLARIPGNAYDSDAVKRLINAHAKGFAKRDAALLQSIAVTH
jgi:hypothetical protein